MSKDLGNMLKAGGKAMLGGLSTMHGGPPLSGAIGGLSGLGGGEMSGASLIEQLFKKLGIFGNDHGKDRMDPNSDTFVGPRP